MNRGRLKALNDPLNYLESIWHHSESPIPPTSILTGTFYATSYIQQGGSRYPKTLLKKPHILICLSYFSYTVVCKIVHKTWSVWCKMALEEIGV